MFDSVHAVMVPVKMPSSGGDGGFRPYKCAELSVVGAECGGDDEGSSSFGESEPEGQSCGGCAEGEGETELDACQPFEVDGGQAGPDDLATGVDVGDGGGGAELVAKAVGDRGGVGAAGVDEERADGVAAGLGGDVAGVGDQEAVLWRGGELVGDPDVVEGNVDVLVGGAVLQAERDGVAGKELEVVDGFGGDQHCVGLGRQLVDESSGGAALEVVVLEPADVGDRGRVDTVEVLEVGADVCEAMLDRFDVVDPGGGCDCIRWPTWVRRSSRGGGDGDVGAVGEERVGFGLLAIGGVERRGRGGEADRERHQCGTAGHEPTLPLQACATVSDRPPETGRIARATSGRPRPRSMLVSR